MATQVESNHTHHNHKWQYDETVGPAKNQSNKQEGRHDAGWVHTDEPKSIDDAQYTQLNHIEDG